MMTIKEALRHAADSLQTDEDARLEAEILLSHVLQVTRTFLYAHANNLLSHQAHTAFCTLVSARKEGHPIAYLIGAKEFWSLTFSVNASTLIPRPETELLVEKILALAPEDSCHILDLGTGSGAIAIALAHTKPHWHITATDIATNALNTARTNAAQLSLKNIKFIVSDWFDHIPHQHFDVIVSNPPYIEESDPHLSRGDLRFEPQQALASGPDGLDALRIIIHDASNFLKPGGLLIVEHGYKQGIPVKTLLQQNHFQHITDDHDLQGHPRVSLGYKAQLFQITL